MNRFVFIAPMYNASKTLERTVLSLVGQSFEEWKLIIIDDCSDYQELEKCQEIIGHYAKRTKNSIKLVINSTKKWEVANVLCGVSMCEDADIICRIDCDDYLTDLDTLAMINNAYCETGCDVLWTMHRWGLSDKNISGPMPSDANPYMFPWVSSHLKTFRKSLLNDVAFENFLNQNGDVVRRAGDRAIMLPVLHRSKKRVFLPRVVYHYTIDEQNGAVYQTDDAKFQKAEADFLHSRGFLTIGEPWERVVNK